MCSAKHLAQGNKYNYHSIAPWFAKKLASGQPHPVLGEVSISQRNGCWTTKSKAIHMFGPAASFAKSHATDLDNSSSQVIIPETETKQRNEEHKQWTSIAFWNNMRSQNTHSIQGCCSCQHRCSSTVLITSWITCVQWSLSQTQQSTSWLWHAAISWA